MTIVLIILTLSGMLEIKMPDLETCNKYLDSAVLIDGHAQVSCAIKEVAE